MYLTFLVKLAMHFHQLPEYPPKQATLIYPFHLFLQDQEKNAVIKFIHSKWILPMLHFELGRSMFLITSAWLDFWTFLSFVLWLSIQTILNFQDMLLDFIISWMHTSVLYFRYQLDFLGCKAHFIVNGFMVLECQVLLLFLFFYSGIMHIPFYPKALKY